MLVVLTYVAGYISIKFNSTCRIVKWTHGVSLTFIFCLFFIVLINFHWICCVGQVCKNIEWRYTWFMYASIIKSQCIKLSNWLHLSALTVLRWSVLMVNIIGLITCLFTYLSCLVFCIMGFGIDCYKISLFLLVKKGSRTAWS